MQQLYKHQSVGLLKGHFVNIPSGAPVGTLRLCMFFSDNFFQKVSAHGRKTEYLTTLAL